MWRRVFTVRGGNSCFTLLPGDVARVGARIIVLLLVRLYPVIHGGDRIVRLVNCCAILIRYQLPPLQVPLHPARKMSYFPAASQLLMALEPWQVSGAEG